MEDCLPVEKQCVVNFVPLDYKSGINKQMVGLSGPVSNYDCFRIVHEYEDLKTLAASLPNAGIHPHSGVIPRAEANQGSTDAIEDLTSNRWGVINRSHSDTALNRIGKTPDGDLTPPYLNFARYLPCLTTPSNDNSSSTFSVLSASTVTTSNESDSTVRLPFTASQLSLPEPPDGGWGWVVVAAAFVVHMIIEGVIVSFGIFIEDLVEEFNESMSATSWVGSFSYGIPALVTPISSMVLNRYGCRFTCILGALISTLGCLIGCFVNSLLALIFTFGILSGLGTSLSMTAALVIVSMYFEDRRATATGLSIAGTGVGALVFAPAVEFLITIYTWRGTFLLMAGALLHIAICGALMRPVETKVERTDRQRLAWLEHLTKESGLSGVIKTDEYLNHDVLGRIKLLRDRLLAPRKCTGRTHAVVKLPLGVTNKASTTTSTTRNFNFGTSLRNTHGSTYNTNAINAAMVDSCSHYPRIYRMNPLNIVENTSNVQDVQLPVNESIDLVDDHKTTAFHPFINHSPNNTHFHSGELENKTFTKGLVSKHRYYPDQLIRSALDLVSRSRPHPLEPKHLLKRSVSSPLATGHPAGPFKSPVIHLAYYPSGFRSCVITRCAKVPKTNECGYDSSSIVNSNMRECLLQPSPPDCPLPSNPQVLDKQSVPEELCRVHRGSLLKAFGLKRASQCRALSLPDLTQVHRVRRGWDAEDNGVVNVTCCSNLTSNRKDTSGKGSVEYDETCALLPVNYLSQCGVPLPEIDARQLCRQLCDVRIFRRTTFDLFVLSNFLLYFWYNVTYFFMGVHALKLGMSETKAALLFSVLGGANMVGEIVVGLVADRECIDALTLYLFMLLACGISTSLVPLFHTFTTLSIYTAVFGIGMAANDALCTILLVKFVGLHRLTNALGICFFCQGVANIIGPPTIGFIIDSTGSQNLAFLISGIGLILSALVVIPIIAQRIHRRRARRLARRVRALGGANLSITQLSQKKHNGPTSNAIQISTKSLQ